MSKTKKKKNELELEEFQDEQQPQIEEESADDIVKKVLKENEDEIIKDYFTEDTKDDYFEEDNIVSEENIVNDFLKKNYEEEIEEKDNKTKKKKKKEEEQEEKEEVEEDEEEYEENDYSDYEIEETSTSSGGNEKITSKKVAKFYIVLIIVALTLILVFVYLKYNSTRPKGEILLKDKDIIENLNKKIDILSTKKLDGKGSYYIKNMYSQTEVKNITDSEKELLIVANFKYNKVTLTDYINLALKKAGYDPKTNTNTTTCNKSIASCNSVYITDEVDYKKQYKELFNEEKSPSLEIEDDCKTYYYLEDNNQFVLDDPCTTSARASISEDMYYKDVYTTKDDEVYVYVQKAMKYCYSSNNNTTCGVNNGIKDGETDVISLTEEEYKNFSLTEENKSKFKTFKFTFKKGKNNNYYFVSQKLVA